MSVEDKIDRLFILVERQHRETLDKFMALDARLVAIETWGESAARLLAPLALPLDDDGKQIKLDDVLRGLTGLSKTSFDEFTNVVRMIKGLCHELHIDFDELLRQTTEPAAAPSGG